MATIYLSLGSNLGNKKENLKNAVLLLSEEIGEVISTSSLYQSKPWGFESENDFINSVIIMKTFLSPFDILSKIKEIEKKLGRNNKTGRGYEDRVIDIDILFYEDLIIDTPELKIPHPFIHMRDFVLIPLAEIAPAFIHPLIKKDIREILKNLGCN